MSSATPVGATHLKELVKRLQQLDRAIKARPQTNDMLVADIVQTAQDIIVVHGTWPKPAVADDLANLLAAIRNFPMPDEREDDETALDLVEQIESWLGRVRAPLEAGIDITIAMGFPPTTSQFANHYISAIPSLRERAHLSAINERLQGLQESLDALRSASRTEHGIEQRSGLLSSYLGSMRVEINLTKLHINASVRTIDIAAVARAAEIMANLTADFSATLRAWGRNVADTVVTAAEAVATRMSRLVSGLVTEARVRLRKFAARPKGDTPKEKKAPRSPSPPQAAPDHVDQPYEKPASRRAPLVAHVDDFQLRLLAARSMILRGEELPEDILPWITDLDFSSTVLSDLTPISRLRHLRRLDLQDTFVTDLGPLAAIRSLQTLRLDNTKVADLGPLKHLVQLQRLILRGTPVTDLTPLSRLFELRILFVDRTKVQDISPLSGLKKLNRLFLQETHVTDVTPLARLPDLKWVNLHKTDVLDMSPISRVEQIVAPNGDLHLGKNLKR